MQAILCLVMRILQIALLLLLPLIAMAQFRLAPQNHPANVFVLPSSQFPSMYLLLSDRKLQASLSSTIKVLSPEISLVSKDCGVINSWYNPQDKTITLCYEYLADGDRFIESKYRNLPYEIKSHLKLGIMLGVLLHELGHAVIDVQSFPVLGGEEEAADMIATIVMLDIAKANPEQGKLFFTGNIAYSWGRRTNTISKILGDRHLYADEHPLNEQRVFKMVCLAYGSNPELFGSIAQELQLPKERAVRCPSEYSQAKKAVTLLEQNAKKRITGYAE